MTDLKTTRLYAVTAILIIMICTALTGMIEKSAGKYSHQVVLGMIGATYNEARQVLDYESRILGAMAESASFGGVRNMDEAIASLRVIEEGRGRYGAADGSVLAVMDANGDLYSADGGKYSSVQFYDPDSLQKGWMASTVYDRSSGESKVALVAPVPSKFRFYLARIESRESFAGHLIEGLYPRRGYVAVFDGHGNIAAALPGGDGERGEGEGIVSGGLAAFGRLNRSQSAEPFGGGLGYRAYRLLGEPQGWLIGAYFQTPSLQTLSVFIRQAATLFLILLLLLIVTAVMIGARLKGDLKARSDAENSSDKLTGLKNGLGMTACVEEFLKGRDPSAYKLVCIDITGFNRFNIMFGYSAGDNLLRAVAGVLVSGCHCGTRLNSDVFMALADDSADMADNLRESLTRAVAERLGGEYTRMVSFKFGVCGLSNDPGMFRNAFDAALLSMKDAKNPSRRGDVVYSEDLQGRMEARKNIERGMFSALSNGEFRLFIQPKWDLSAGICGGGEALIRWQTDEAAIIPPDEFVPVFESNGFIVEVDFFILSKVLQMLQREIEDGFETYPISVNLSRVTLTFPNYMARLAGTVDKYNVPHEYIEFEITESALFGSDYDSVRSLLRSLKKMGFSLSMDDFGSGYSSLNTLRELPVDVLKIDREFLMETVTSEKSKKIIKSIVDMSKQIGIKVVCEGVESEDQLEFLKSVGCDYGQGYLFATPMPYNEFEDKFVKFVKIS